MQQLFFVFCTFLISLQCYIVLLMDIYEILKVFPRDMVTTYVPEELCFNAPADLRAIDYITYGQNRSYCLVDVYRKELKFPTNETFFYALGSPDNLDSLGLNHDEEVKRNLQTLISAFRFILTLPKDQQLFCDVSFCVKGQLLNEVIDFDVRYSIFRISQDGKIWLLLNSSGISPFKHESNKPYILNKVTGDRYYHVNGRWKLKVNQHNLLTDREKLVLVLSSQGYTSDEIGKRLAKSGDTIKTDKRKIYEKLGVKTIEEAITAFNSFNLLAY